MPRKIATLSPTADLEGILMRATENPTSIQIENRALNGVYHVQQIGIPASTVGVSFICEDVAFRKLQLCATTGAPITVYYDTNMWTGIISGGSLPFEYILPCSYKVDFVLLLGDGYIA
jgi:hypothetical protein